MQTIRAQQPLCSFLRSIWIVSKIPSRSPFFSSIRAFSIVRLDSLRSRSNASLRINETPATFTYECEDGWNFELSSYCSLLSTQASLRSMPDFKVNTTEEINTVGLSPALVPGTAVAHCGRWLDSHHKGVRNLTGDFPRRNHPPSLMA
jgi:hypothetical protein